MWRPLILRKYFHVSEGQRIGWTSYAVLTLRCERFSSVNKTEENLYIFNNGVCPHSMQHRPFSDLDISSARQGNPGTSRNQKIHHRVQNSQPLVTVLRQVNQCRTLIQYFWKMNFNNILPFATSSSKCSSSFKFPHQNALCISLFLICATRFPPLVTLI